MQALATTPPHHLHQRRFLLLAVLAAALGGCGSVELPREDSHAFYKPLVESYCKCETRTTRYPTQRPGGPTVNVALHQTAAADDRVYVFVHGVLADARTWRHLAGAMSEAKQPMIMVDLPGCGDSDKPDGDVYGDAVYSPDALADHIGQALGAHVADWPAGRRITLVGHSLGGVVCLRLMGNPALRRDHADWLNRVDHLVLLTPADLEILDPPQVFAQLGSLSSLQFALADAIGYLDYRLAHASSDAVCDRTRATREECDQKAEILRNPDTRRAFQAMLRGAHLWKNGRPDRPAMKRITDDYRNVNVPCLILWGQYDEVFTPTPGYKITAHLPDALFHIVADCKHSPHLEHPRLCAEAITAFTRSRTVPHEHIDSGRLIPALDSRAVSIRAAE